ncbi:MAG: rhodanese-like domain-containing protein [Planctomycetales bacterium]|nr:rhodanese-like domain-containing protein [Planctomycetales bacterium]
MIKTITPAALAQQKMADKTVQLIDVRTPVEYREAHVEFAENLPLNELDVAKLAAERRELKEPLYVICRSGGRAGQACEKLTSAGGGTLAWDAAGLPVVRGKKSMSLERQVRILIGSMVLLSSVLAFYSVYWIGLTAFFGAGLNFSGITDFCGLALILARMPWNQVGIGSQQPQSSCAVPRD